MSNTVTGTDTDYAILRLWGLYMVSGASYASDQLALARQERAPWNAIYRRDDGWHTTDEITNLAALDFLGIPEQARRRNTLTRYRNDVINSRDALEAKAQTLRAFDPDKEGVPIDGLAHMLDRAARSCDAVVCELALVLQGYPSQQRDRIEPAVQQRLREVTGA